LTDPHGTHRQCLVAIIEAIERVKKGLNFEFLLYRGAWQEWTIEMVIKYKNILPLAIFKVFANKKYNFVNFKL